MRAVNLLPRDSAKQKSFVTQQNLPAVVGGGLGVVVVGALALTFLQASGKVAEAKTHLTDVQAALAATPKPPPPQPVPNSQLAGEQSARVTAVSTAIGGRVAWDRILREFSLVLPDDVWIASLALSPDSGLSISGTTYSHESVARLLTRLELIPELTNITLASSASSGPAGAGVLTFQFSINALVSLPPGAAAVLAPPPPPPPPVSTDTTATAAPQ
jgi:Tfp pilus assembly protein PilN